LDTLTGIPVFETGSFSHSDTCPEIGDRPGAKLTIPLPRFPVAPRSRAAPSRRAASGAAAPVGSNGRAAAATGPDQRPRVAPPMVRVDDARRARPRGLPAWRLPIRTRQPASAIVVPPLNTDSARAPRWMR